MTEEELGSLSAKLTVVLWSVQQYADDDDMKFLREIEALLKSDDSIKSQESYLEMEQRWLGDHQRALLWADQSKWYDELISEMLDRWQKSSVAPAEPDLFHDILRRIAAQRAKLKVGLRSV